MKKYSKPQIIELLKLPYDEFCSSIMCEAKNIHRLSCNKLTVTAMLGYSNVCKNHCLYCGMRADNPVKRYRFTDTEIIDLAQTAFSEGIRRMFLVSGEDPKYDFQQLLNAVSGIKGLGMFITMASGELEPEQYKELKAAGLDEYVMKFEMSDREDFNRLNPSTSYERRLGAIAKIKEAGLLLASGNIVGYPGHTIEHIADDILLMNELGISWAPIIPFMPAVNTPLASEPRGDYTMNLREISILRLMLPNIRITAQQPGSDMRDGLGGHDGNLAALNAGADILFTDLLPAAMAGNFKVVDRRMLGNLDFIRSLAEEAGMEIDF